MVNTLARLITLIIFLHTPFAIANGEKITVGSKAFTEGYIIGEILAQTLEAKSAGTTLTVERKLGMGGTGILFQALMNGDIQLYPEYTGTIAEVILKKPELKGFAEIQSNLKALGLVMSLPLGFNNTYALASRSEFAEKKGLTKISEIASILPTPRIAFSHEFTTRNDGVPGLSRVYGLRFGGHAMTMEHSLAYEAIKNSIVDIIDVYSTDAKIEKLDLVLLRDDRGLFPSYDAVILARLDFVSKHPEIWTEIQSLYNQIDEETMRSLNSAVDHENKSYESTANSFLGKVQRTDSNSDLARARLGRRTQEHFLLVSIALLFSIVVGVPLGIVASQSRFLGQTILLLSGLVQTIPSLALLCFLIPVFGIGTGAAIVALCLYGLLPVVINTFTGLKSIDPRLLEMSDALGLSKTQSLIRIRLPLASRSIMAGIKTSAIVGIGTATLAALIGAGGYGATILSGLTTNDNRIILYGAAPAALMALGTHLIFELLGTKLIPKGLRD